MHNKFIDWEGEAGEAPAEPWRHQLGRSLALPLKPLAGSFQSAARLIATRMVMISEKCHTSVVQLRILRVVQTHENIARNTYSN